MSQQIDSTLRFDLCLRLAALALLIAALGLPVNDLYRYGLLVLIAIPIFAGTLSCNARTWAAAIGIVAASVAVGMVFPAPHIEEGHNVFVVDGPGGALERGLPADAFRHMTKEFDSAYPPATRCKQGDFGCWRSNPLPDRPFAHATDSIWTGAEYSRRVTGINFSDPVWQRLGFINELSYNWTGSSDLQRGKRNRWWMILNPWQLTMPYFIMYRFPSEFTGSELCWQGTVLWEGADERFATWRHDDFSCRPVESADIGRRIFGISIASPLAMVLNPPLKVQLHNLVKPALVLIAAAMTLLLLVRWRQSQLALPSMLIGFSLLIIVLNDASFIGGVRPFDGGDDGLAYEGFARKIVQHLMDGDYALALQGGESVYYYGGPGLRYFLAGTHFIFGDTFLGHLTLILLLPLLLFVLFRRFLGERIALALTLIFILFPIGAAFGTTYYQYAKWAARGYADPAAATMFIAALIVLIGPANSGPKPEFLPALGAGILFALALWLRPNLAPAAGILLGGACLAALWQMQWQRIAGLCIGFTPALGMALHNWVFGGVFVLFSSNATIAEAVPMPPSAYVSALLELMRLDFAGEHLVRALLQMARWLSGPSESFLTIPLHVAAIAVLVHVVVWGKRHDPWLRLIAGATLAQHPVAFFYLSYGRYYYLAWVLTFLVCAVWGRETGLGLFRSRFPQAADTIAAHPLRRWFERSIDWWMKRAGLVPAAR